MRDQNLVEKRNRSPEGAARVGILPWSLSAEVLESSFEKFAIQHFCLLKGEFTKIVHCNASHAKNDKW